MNPNVPTGAATLLAFIARAETARSGDAAYRTIIRHKEGTLAKPVTEFTLGELLSAQKTWGKQWGSSAAGAYQIIYPTLLDLCAKLGLKAEQRFNAALQDVLGYELLKQRGYAQFIAGTLPLKKFALALSKEWASIPVLERVEGKHGTIERGSSYYAGDGMNGATVTPGDVEAVLSDILNRAHTPLPVPAPAPAPPPPPADWDNPKSDHPIEEHEEPIAPPAKPRRINWWIVAFVAIAIGLVIVAFVPISI